MRVYLPTTLAALPGILSAGELAPAPLHGYGVTPALREAYASGDEEELEYVAMLTAARESLRLLAADKAAPRRRVVLAADVPDPEVTAIPYDDEPAAVTIGSAIALLKLASAHIDDADAEEDVAAAAEASPAADAGSGDAQFTVDSADAHELAWYATQELQWLARGDDPPAALPGGIPRTPGPRCAPDRTRHDLIGRAGCLRLVS